jgi:hypothetical protein
MRTTRRTSIGRGGRSVLLGMEYGPDRHKGSRRAAEERYKIPIKISRQPARRGALSLYGVYKSGRAVAPRAADGRFDVDALRTGEWIVRPGLVYALEEKRKAGWPALADLLS